MKNTEKQTNEQSAGFSFSALWENVKSIWWVAAILTVFFAVVAYIIFTITFVPRYKSTARFTIVPLVDSNASSGASVYVFNYNETLSQQMAATFPHIIAGGFLTEVVLADVGRPVGGVITAKAVEDTNIFELHVTSTSAQDAYDILCSLINNYPKIAEHVVGDTRMNMLAGSEPILSTTPYNANDVYKYVFAGAAIGLIFGVILILIRMYTRETVMSKRDVEVNFNGRCICEVPEVQSKRSSTQKGMLKATPQLSGFSESMRVLKQRVKLNAAAKGFKVIGITSAIRGEGKTTISYNLAKSLSSSRKKVVLVDADFSDRALQSILNRKNEVENTGITEIVNGHRKIEECINSVSNTFDVLFAGSEEIKFLKKNYVAIFHYLREHYDYVIVDMPACGTAESASLADFCDGVLFTIKWNSTGCNRIMNAIKYLAFSDTTIMGYILNAVSIEHSSYGGYKYYGRYGTRRYGYGYTYGGYRRRYGYGYNFGYNAGYGYGVAYGYGYGTTSDLIKQETTESKILNKQ